MKGERCFQSSVCGVRVCACACATCACAVCGVGVRCALCAGGGSIGVGSVGGVKVKEPPH